MKALMNFAGAILIIALIVVLVMAYSFFKKSDTEDGQDKDKAKADPDDDKDELDQDETFDLKKAFKDFMKVDEKNGRTVLIDMPVVYYRLPGKEQKWNQIELTQSITTIGRGSDNDICLNDQTVSREHAQIIMKLRKKDKNHEGVKYFLLKNLSKENPVSVLDMEADEDDENPWYDILKSIPLAYDVNIFFIGNVEFRVMIKKNKQKHILANDFPGESKAEGAAAKTADAVSADENTAGDTMKKSDREKTASEETARGSLSAKAADQGPDVVVNDDLHNDQAKVIKRAPRSKPRY